MDKAYHVVERFTIDRDARMALLDHAFEDLGKRCLHVECNDVHTRDHYVCSSAVVNLQNIADEDALMRAQQMRTFRGRFLDHFIDGLAQAIAIAWAPDQAQKAAEWREGPIVFRLAAGLGRLGFVHGRTASGSIDRLT